jgi:5'-deoxynucleotidase YfbR-like HD superfamily hydrolase
MTLDQLKLALRKLHKIPRLNGHILTKTKSVLEHSARVAMIYQFLGGKEVFQALMHDYSEAVLGFDPPSPIKEKIPAIREFENLPENKIPFEDKNEYLICKIADSLELLLDIKEQQQLGNSTPEIMEMHDQVLEELMEKAAALGRKNEIKKLIQKLIS